MLIGHLSDLHLREDGDVIVLERQLDRIAAEGATHLAITGDLLDRWDPRLLTRALDALERTHWLHASRTTIIHGNHDLASSGGHPRRRADLFRLAIRFWDPPPLIAARKRRFYAAIEERAPGVAAPAPHLKQLPDGVRIAVVDTVPVPWRPLTIDGGEITVRHAVGTARTTDLDWLGSLERGTPLILLLHHYPLDAPTFRWSAAGLLRRVIDQVHVPMAIPEPERAALWSAARKAGVALILCGHVHRARFESQDGIAVGLNGESGAEWAGRTIAYYELTPAAIRGRTVALTQNL